MNGSRRWNARKREGAIIVFLDLVSHPWANSKTSGSATNLDDMKLENEFDRSKCTSSLPIQVFDRCL